MPHFRTPAWATWLGYLSTGSLAAIFASQGIAQAWESEPLARVAFEGLGQHVEGWLLNGFLVWCLVAVLTGGAGKSKAFGLVAVAMAAGVRIYAAALSSSGGSLETTAPALKLLYLVPFVWLLLATAGWRQRRG